METLISIHRLPIIVGIIPTDGDCDKMLPENVHTKYWNNANCVITREYCTFNPNECDCTKCNVPIISAIGDLRMDLASMKVKE